MTHPLDFAAVALGGAIGAVVRYGITVAATSFWLARDDSSGPMWGTLIANLVGCLLLGLGFQFFLSQQDPASGWLSHRMWLLVRVGVLGGLTTFSTLIGEAAILAGNERMSGAAMILAANLIGGWVLFWAGGWAVRSWVG